MSTTPECLQPQFTGSFRYTLDAKHRILLPVLFGARLGSPLWLTLGDRYLGLRSAAEWERTHLALPTADAERFCVLSWERAVNTTGRIQLPHAIWSEYGWGPGEEVVIVGQRSWVRVEKMADWHARVRGEGQQLTFVGMNGAVAGVGR